MVMDRRRFVTKHPLLKVKKLGVDKSVTQRLAAMGRTKQEIVVRCLRMMADLEIVKPLDFIDVCSALNVNFDKYFALFLALRN